MTVKQSGGDRERLRRKADEQRAQRQAAKAERDAERRRERSEARRTGRPFVEVRPDPMAGQVHYDNAVTSAGIVEFLNPAGFDYDFVVTVEVDPGGPRCRARPVVAAVEMRRRIGGPDISARRIQTSRPAWIMRQAAALLTTGSGVESEPLGISEDSARAMLDSHQRQGRRRTVEAPELELVATAWRLAQHEGKPVRAAVARVLERAGYPHSEAVVKNRLTRCRAEGRIPPAGGSTRPRL